MESSDPTRARPPTVAEGVLDRILEDLRAGAEPDVARLAAEYAETPDDVRQLVAVVRMVQSVASSADPDAGVEPPRAVPERVGDYRLIREIGRGGMGVVYEAEQVSLRRRVALKVLLPGVRVSSRVAQRFDREARTAGGLDHPHIVPVYSVGCDQNLRYYAMRLIDGRPLSAPPGAARHASGGRPPPAVDYRRIAHWGAQVADALAYAHSAGVIHRDVKPSNILIDAGGSAWITDFGLARQQQDLTLTVPGDVLGTYRYMSPEQARGGGTVDERTDVYSLGVTLYELVAGQPPFLGPDRESTLRQVLLEEPRPLRRADRHVPAPLATIIHRAMEKSADGRYPSAAVMAEDLRRFLDHRPLLTRTPGLWSQCRRIAQRHRRVVAAAGLLFAVVAAFGAWMSVLYARAEHLRRAADLERAGAVIARDAEARARARAEVEATRAREVQSFIEGMLRSVNPDIAQTRDTAILIDLLDAAARRVREDLADDPEVASAVQATIGATYRALGRYDEAEEHIRAALDARVRILGPEHPDTRRSRRDWANLLQRRGRTAEAVTLGRACLEIDRRAAGESSADALSSANVLVLALLDQGAQPEAEDLARHTAAAARAALGARHEVTIQSISNLAVALEKAARLDEAEPLLLELYQDLQLRLGSQHPGTLTVLGNLASVLSRMGRIDEGLELSRRVMEISRTVYPADHPARLIDLANYATALHRAGRLEEAEPYVRAALKSLRRILGEDHPDALTGLYNYAGLLTELGRLEEAEPLMWEALERYRRVSGPESADAADAMAHVASLLTRQGRHAEALGLLEPAAALAQRLFPPDSVRAAGILSDYGGCLSALECYDQAEPLLIAALATLRTQLGNSHRYTQEAAARLMVLYDRTGREPELAVLLQEFAELP